MNNNGLALVAPRITPALDPSFRPAVLANHAFRSLVRSSGNPVSLGLALEQTDGNVSHFRTEILPESHPQAAGNFIYVERILRLLIWSRGGFRIHLQGPLALTTKLAAYYRDTATGKFDSNIVAERMFDHPLEIVHARGLPAERNNTTA